MSGFMISGIYRDKLMDKNGQPIYDSGWKSNLIVLRCRELLAGFMKNDAALGIRSLQVGQGDPAWDTTPPPAPNPETTTQLFDTTSPFTIPHTDLTLQYLDASEAIVAGPTNRIEIITTLGSGQPPPVSGSIYPLREFGLFGELNGAPFMIDYIIHPLIEKDTTVTLERRLRLIF